MTVIDEKPNPNISTFRPLDQKINSNIKYNGINIMTSKHENITYHCTVEKQSDRKYLTLHHIKSVWLLAVLCKKENK